MNRNRGIRRDFRLIGAAALVTVACSNPPSDLVTQAREAEQVAIAGGAQEYAPEALDAVAEARAALEAELAAQQDRWAIRRSYKQAEVLAESYRMAGEAAALEASQAREEARVAAVAMIAESRSLLEEVRGMLAVAPVGKGSAADLAALRGDLDAAQAGLDAAERSVGSELYLEAESAAQSARAIVDSVKAALEQARAIRAG